MCYSPQVDGALFHAAAGPAHDDGAVLVVVNLGVDSMLERVTYLYCDYSDNRIL